MGMSLRRVGLGLVVSAGLVFGAAVPSSGEDTRQIGGPGGKGGGSHCAPGQLVSGFDYSSGKALDYLNANCWDPSTGRFKGATGGLGATIDLGTKNRTADCPLTMAVQSMRVFVDKHGIVHHVEAVCGGLAENWPTGKIATTNSGGEASYSEEISCPRGFLASALIGAYGVLVDRVGLRCTKVYDVGGNPPPAEKPAEKPPARAPMKVTNDQAPLKVNNGAGGDGGDYAAVDTTIYDEPAGNEVDYISEGDPVTIRSCTDGWCRITEPRRGYVWGEDVGR